MSEPIERGNVLLEVDGLRKYFPKREGVFRKVVGHVKAVDGISFRIYEGETVALVGESGCGKTTTGRCILRLIEPTEGSVYFHHDGGMDNILEKSREELRGLRRNISMIFQDPYSALENRMLVKDIISEPLRIQKVGTKQSREAVAEDLLGKVGLRHHHMNRYPHEFSGGQRQRIGIARALALQPKLIICDEPVSALDVSVQAQVLNLLLDLQIQMNLTYLFISHDLSAVNYASDRVLVMYLGKIVEEAPTAQIYQDPKHPYTEALLSSIPTGDPKAHKKRIILTGNVPDPSSPPSGCSFHTRCRYAVEKCGKVEPILVDTNGSGHLVACHRVDDLTLKGYGPGQAV